MLGKMVVVLAVLLIVLGVNSMYLGIRKDKKSYAYTGIGLTIGCGVLLIGSICVGVL